MAAASGKVRWDGHRCAARVNRKNGTGRFERPRELRAEVRRARDEEPRSIKDLSRLRERDKRGVVVEGTSLVEGADLRNRAGSRNAGRHDVRMNGPHADRR